MSFKNSIIRHGTETAAELKAKLNPKNWRTHPEKQSRAVKSSLTELGWIAPVIVNEKTGRLIDGHLRIELAGENGEAEIPVTYVNLSEKDEALALATFDPLSALAEADPEIWGQLQEMIDTDDEALLSLMAETEDDMPFGEDFEPVGGGGDEVVSKADELLEKWGTETGQLWQLGNHRLLCGDCTYDKNLERLMNGEKADMVFADPPYGGVKMSAAKFKGDLAQTRKLKKLVKATADLYDFDPTNILDILPRFSSSKADWFFFANIILVPQYLNCAIGAKRKFDILCWHKINFLPLTGGSYYPDTEYLIKVKGTGSVFNTGIPKDIVNYGKYWILPSEQWGNEKIGHPTIKPEKIIHDQFLICSKKGDKILDPFCGSGTTILVGEKLGRNVYAVEIEPKYVAVAIERFYQQTGIEPKML